MFSNSDGSLDGVACCIDVEASMAWTPDSHIAAFSSESNPKNEKYLF
jgi:hypothetical protein